jgi:hypothetical protein
MDEVPRIPAAIDRGDPRAAERLLPLVHDELRWLAAPRMALAGRTIDEAARALGLSTATAE